ncbi:WALL-ASSOCIATED RECEPTOR KINASE-LIKE 14 [Salix purpurea]|uniref:WALL-ASSOCIATED RECEPTOR KINASE-LIKE 14 n=1 Tax=Salix purpurea TaxID=77065 RepID=A0A9Q0P0M9_SALPP|nr:WALL-ASSOCIATED RECEPTOR KINASE-LIKE 14 [Salix purpurea]
MILQQHSILFLAIFFVSLIGGHESIKFSCNRTCGAKHLPYPFGFSASCDIHLNCSQNGDMLINEFPVQIVGQDTIKINLEPKCDRPIEALRSLSTKNYAPKSTNAILLNNCTSGFSPCNIPSISVRTHFESLNCSNNSSLSCFSRADSANGFFDYNMANISQCKYLLSSISAESFAGSAVSLEIQIMELRWWLQGDCRCSEDAICTRVESPAGSGFRCHCRDGLAGDGYLAGVGCRKDAGCNPAKYLTGRCGAGARPAVFLGGIVVAAVGVGLGLVCCLARRNSISKAKSFRKLHPKKVLDFSRPRDEVNLASLAIDRIGRGRLDEIIDPFLDLHSDAWTFSSVHKVAELAFRCLAFLKDTRPSMMEVAAELEQIMLTRWPSSEEINCTTSLDSSPSSSSSNDCAGHCLIEYTNSARPCDNGGNWKSLWHLLMLLSYYARKTIFMRV